MDSESYVAEPLSSSCITPPFPINLTLWFLQFQESTCGLEVEYYVGIKERSRFKGWRKHLNLGSKMKVK